MDYHYVLRTAAKMSGLPDHLLDDIAQEAWIHFNEKYDPSRGAETTFLHWSVKRAIHLYHYRRKKQKRLLERAGMLYRSKIYDPSHSLLDLREWTAKLLNQKQNALLWRVLEGMKYEDIGKEFGISRQRVQQLYDRSLTRLTLAARKERDRREDSKTKDPIGVVETAM